MLDRRNVVLQAMADAEFVKNRSFDREADILKVLGHPIRLKIVAGLMSQSCNVKKIWECLGLPQAFVSRHLAILRDAGVLAVDNVSMTLARGEILALRDAG